MYSIYAGEAVGASQLESRANFVDSDSWAERKRVVRLCCDHFLSPLTAIINFCLTKAKKCHTWRNMIGPRVTEAFINKDSHKTHLMARFFLFFYVYGHQRKIVHRAIIFTLCSFNWFTLTVWDLWCYWLRRSISFGQLWKDFWWINIIISLIGGAYPICTIPMIRICEIYIECSQHIYIEYRNPETLKTRNDFLVQVRNLLLPLS